MSYDTGLVTGFFISDVARTDSGTSGKYFPGTSRKVTVASSAKILPKEKFAGLAKLWKGNTARFSDIHDIITDQNYSNIIAMGEEALPFILNDLKNGPNHWYYALAVISGEDPSENEEDGDLEACCRAWLNWGVERGYID